jgi:hypothetical protein
MLKIVLRFFRSFRILKAFKKRTLIILIAFTGRSPALSSRGGGLGGPKS